MANKTDNELKTLLDGIVAMADAERQKSDGFKDLFEGSANIESLLRRTRLDMTTSVLNATHTLKTKFGYERIPDEAYWLLAALPFLEGRLTKHIQATQGRSCSVDKSFYLLAEALKAALSQPQTKDSKEDK